MADTAYTMRAALMSSSSMAALRLAMPPHDLEREREIRERVAAVLGVTLEDMQTSLATNKVLRRIMERQTGPIETELERRYWRRYGIGTPGYAEAVQPILDRQMEPM